MLKEIHDVLAGSIYWTLLKVRDSLDYSKVVLVLTGDNEEVDYYSILYLDKVIERKNAKEAVIYVMDQNIKVLTADKLQSKYPVKIKIVSKKILNYIYRRYTIERFYKNIFWTFTDHTKNNLLGRFMKETDIDAEDVVCLAIYNFRQIPDGVIVKNVCSRIRESN